MAHLHGKFVWFEHLGPDPGRALDFYGPLLGWRREAAPRPGGEPYPLLLNGSDRIGGLLQGPAGVPAHWLGYLSVPDVDAAHAQALAAGATSLRPPADFGGFGRGATLCDPTGAVFAVWKSAGGDRVDRDVPDGDWLWNELMTTDAPRALRFYAEVFGFGHEAVDMAGEGTYFVLKKDGAARGGLVQTREPSIPSNWLPYVRASDCDALAERARALGGHVLMEPFDVAGVGRIAVFADPLGAAFAVMRPLPGSA